MKEIEFLPEWYKKGRQRRVSYRAQYVALGCILLLMFVWNFVTENRISSAQAKLSKLKGKAAIAKKEIAQYQELSERIRQIKSNAQLLEETNSNVSVPAVMAEISFLVEPGIVLTDLQFQAKAVKKDKGTSNSGMLSVVTVGKDDKKKTFIGDTKFKLTMTGMASDSGKVAELMTSFEDSDYFRDVQLAFSRNTRYGGGSQQKEKLQTVSKFEIHCYLANFRNSDKDK